jgi:hypothetical protein
MGSPRATERTSTTVRENKFKEAAKIVLALTEKQLAVRLERGDFVEVTSE